VELVVRVLPIIEGSNTLFKRPFHTIVAPKLLFYRIEQCQEIMTLGMLPYMMEHTILLMALQIFPLREFDMWENTTIERI
jgi:hypothetical protein